MTNAEIRTITDKWANRIGLGFNPDTRGADYTPALPADMIAEYERDMDDLFAKAWENDIYEIGLISVQSLLPASEA